MNTEQEPVFRERQELEAVPEQSSPERQTFSPEQESLMDQWAEYLERSLRGSEAALKMLAEKFRSARAAQPEQEEPQKREI